MRKMPTPSVNNSVNVSVLAALGAVSALAVADLAAAQGTPVAWWRMAEQTERNDSLGFASPNPAILDERTSSGQGTTLGTNAPIANLADDPIWYFDADPGDGVNGYSTDAASAPASMLNVTPDNVSYAAYSRDTVGSNVNWGVLEFPADFYGAEFNFSANSPGTVGTQPATSLIGEGFTFEMVYQTTDTSGNAADQSNAGEMELFNFGQGEAILNFGGNAGDIGFILVTNDSEQVNPVVVTALSMETELGTDLNFADGQWHYVRATFDDPNDVMSVSVLSEDGTITTASLNTTPDHTLQDGIANIKVAANDVNPDPLGDGSNIGRHLIGLVDEVQITAGLVSDSDALALLTSSFLDADFNMDGIVDLLDLDILGGNWNMNGTPTTGDANGDGTVDLLDLDILGAQWQQSSSFAEALASSGIAVPEPASMVLVAAGTALVIRRRRAA